MENKWYTIREIANELNLSVTAIRNAILRQDLKAVHLGNRVLIKETDYIAFLTNCTVKAPNNEAKR